MRHNWLNQPTIGTKVMLGFGLIALALVAAPLAMYMVESGQALHAARLKQTGITPIKTLLRLVQVLQRHRGLSTGVLGGHAALKTQRVASQTDVDNAVEVFDAMVRADIRDPVYTVTWRKVVETWRGLAKDVTVRTISDQESFAKHTALIDENLKLLDLTLDHFGLSYDPSGDEYHLVMATLVHIPQLTEFLGQLRARGSLSLATKRLSPTDRTVLIGLISNVERQRWYIEREVHKVMTRNPHTTAELSGIATASRVLVQKSIYLTKTYVVEAGVPNYPPVEYWAVFTQAIDDQFRLIEKGMAQLEGVLQARSATIRRSQDQTIGFIALVFACAVWLGAVFVRALKQDIVTLQQSEEAQRRHAKELEARQRVTESILRVPNLTERLSIALREILALLPPTLKGAIYLVEHGRLVLKVEEGYSQVFLALGRDVSVEACPWVGALTERCTPWEGSDPIVEGLRQEGVMAWMSLPLIVEERFGGFVLLANSQATLMEEEASRTLRSMVDQVAVALHDARLYAESRERLARLITLREIDQAIAAQLPLEGVIDLLLKRVHPHMKTDAVGLSLINWEKKRTLLSHLYLPEGVDIRDEAFSLGESLLEVIGVRLQPVIIYDLTGDPRVINHRGIIRQYGLKSYLGVPLIVQGQAIGILHVFTTSPHRFETDEVDFFATLAGQAAISIQNARLYEAQCQATSQLAAKVEELERMQVRLIEAERLKAMGQMAAGVAHDFNNALMGILGQAHLMRLSLEQGPVAALLRGMDGHTGLLECLVRQEQAVQDAAETIRRIREATRPRGEETFGPVAVDELIEQVLAISRPRWKDQAESAGVGIQIRTELDGMPPVLGRASELREALTNLLFNALDAMPTGGTITVSTKLVSSEIQAQGAEIGVRDLESAKPISLGVVEISVTDTGVGMSQSVQARLFEPFFTTKGARGTGLGLSMVHGIIRRHRGEITIQSVEGQGTSVTLRLPIAVAAMPDVAPPPPPSLSARLTFLVIDDDLLLAETLSELLRTLGHEAAIATSGAEGIRRLTRERFDMVLTDLGMPQMSGWEVARAIKANSPRLPVILVTGWGDALERDRLEGTGVDAVLAKPYTVSQLQYAISAACRAHSAGQEGLPSDSGANALSRTES